MDLVRENKDECRLLGDILFLQSQQQPENTAIIWKERIYSYKKLYEICLGFAGTIIESVGRNRNIAVIASRSVDYVIAYFSSLFTGSKIIPIGPDISYEEILRTIKYCDVDLIIYNQDFKYSPEYFENLKSIFLNEKDYAEYEKNINDNFYNKENINEIDVGLMLHTSGSIDKPKRVMLTHRNIIENARAHAIHMELYPSDKVLIMLPMHFGYCNTAQMICHMMLGGILVILDGICLPHKVLKLVTDNKVNVFTAVPSILIQFIDYKYANNYNTSSVTQITFGGAPVSINKIARVKEVFKNAALCQTYGLTEAGPRITGVKPNKDQILTESVGTVIPGVELKFINDSGEVVDTNEIGEIVVRSPGVMRGYYKREDETNNCIKGDWLYTGDLGYLNENRELIIVGRIKNIIIRAGINIYPEEIESYLYSNSKVKQLVVYGEPDEEKGEKVHAKIIAADSSLTIRELQEFAAKGLSKFKIPSFELVKHLPQTYNKKIKRNHE